MRVSLFRGFADNQPQAVEVDWPGFVQNVIGPHKPFTGDKAQSPSFSPAEFKAGTTRAKDTVERLHACVLDFDHLNRSDLDRVLSAASAFRSVVYSSYNHQAEGLDDNRIRVVFAVDRPIEASEWPTFWARLVGELPVAPDVKCSDAGRLYALPHVPRPEAALRAVNEGAPLPVASVLALAPKAPTARVEATGLPTSQPLSVSELRDVVKRLRRVTRGPQATESQAMARWLDQIANGVPFAIEGSRHATYLRITQFLDRAFPQADPAAVGDLFTFSLRAMAGPDFDPATERGEIERAFKGARERRQHAAALAAEEQRQAHEHRIREAFRSDRVTPYTQEEIDGYAKAANVTAAGFRQRWIIAHGKACYVWVAGHYQKPIAVDSLLHAVQRDFAPALESPAGITLARMSPDGKIVTKSEKDLLHDYGTLAREAMASLSAADSYYDAAKQTFFEALTPLRPLVPEADPQIDTWLRALAGPRYGDLILWLQELPDLDQPLSALYLEGPPDSGKSLFSAGLARLWTTTGPTSAVDATENFNDAIGYCPLVVADEILPPAWEGPKGLGRFREFIATRYRTLHRKYLNRLPMVGSVRVVFSANNLDLVDARSQLTPNDRAAVLERIAHIEVGDAAVRFLRGLNRATIDRWVAGDGFARHVLWLQSQGLAERQGRFGVAPTRTRLSDEMVASHPTNSAVAQWLLLHLVDANRLTSPMGGARAPLAFVEGGRYYVNVQALSDQLRWERYVSSPHEVPPPRRLSKALVELSDPGRFQRRKVNYYTIRLDALTAFADTVGLSTAQIEGALLATTAAEIAAVAS